MLDFVFWNENEKDENDKNKAYPIATLKCSEEEYYEDDEFEEFVYKLEEKYGVLDGSGYEFAGRWQVGYQSYEIEEDKIPALIAELREFVIKKGWVE